MRCGECAKKPRRKKKALGAGESPDLVPSMMAALPSDHLEIRLESSQCHVEPLSQGCYGTRRVITQGKTYYFKPIWTVQQFKKNRQMVERVAGNAAMLRAGFVPSDGHSEVAAYQYSELLGLHIMPKAVYGTLDDEVGVFVEGIDGQDIESSINQDGPACTVFSEANQRRLAGIVLLDMMTNNLDRHPENIKLDASGLVWGFDYGASNWGNNSISGVNAQIKLDTRIESLFPSWHEYDDPDGLLDDTLLETTQSIRSFLGRFPAECLAAWDQLQMEDFERVKEKMLPYEQDGSLFWKTDAPVNAFWKLRKLINNQKSARS